MSLKQAIQDWNRQLQANLKDNVAVRTGNLQKSIKTFEEINEGTSETVIEMLEYGQFVDEGTVNMRAQPFIQKSIEETNLDILSKGITEELDKMFDKTFKNQ